ncbi:hypothetical protein J5Y03_14775 [Bacillus sp. RG28]|uniref:Uncharacterized protein n=1 Tax=Gottfriedia endophytica TaxID=2820819 RepID=A0A940SHQ4_9BACI|nr:hypothetical protein [Gottfriedia endophytica]MBP0726422.1 hypothetical protein [Gottfriedia endophytica]
MTSANLNYLLNQLESMKISNKETDEIILRNWINSNFKNNQNEVKTIIITIPKKMISIILILVMRSLRKPT